METEELNLPTEEVEPTTEPEPAKLVQTKPSLLNLRATPNGEIIGTLAKGALLEVTEELGEYYKVVTEQGIEGYVKAEFTE